MKKLTELTKKLQTMPVYGAYPLETIHTVDEIQKQAVFYERFIEQHQEEFDKFINKVIVDQFIAVYFNKIIDKYVKFKKVVHQDDIRTVLFYKTYDDYFEFFRKFSCYDLCMLSNKEYDDIWKDFKQFKEALKYE